MSSKAQSMRRAAVIGAVCACALAWASPGMAAGQKTSARVAALQVALRAHKLYAGPVDGLSGPLTKAGVRTLQRRAGIRPSGRVGPATRRALGPLGRPLLGERELWIGHIGWDVSSLEFRLRRLGLRPGKVDGRFTNATERALQRFQRNSGLRPDGIVGRFTIRALAHVARSSPRPLPVHVVAAGESFFSIAQRYHVSPWQLARVTGCASRGSSSPASGCGCRSARTPRASPRHGGGRSRTRSTIGRPSIASTRSWPVRSRGWSPASSRTSSPVWVRSE